MDEQKNNAPQKAEKAPSRRARWKAHKKEKRAALKAEYKDAPFLTRLFRLYLVKPLVWLLVLALIIGGGAYFLIGTVYEMFYDYVLNQEVPAEKIYAMSPLDLEGQARIEAIPGYDPADTWTISVYIVGSNLEDSGEDDLSGMTEYLTADARNYNASASYEARMERLYRFMDELDAQGATLPEYMYLPVKPVASKTVMTEEVIVADSIGMASSDIAEMRAADLPENVSIVLQTGGATHWSNAMVNPNKTQRFLLNSDGFMEVANLPLQDSCAVETLADFLAFSKEQYPADHQILVLWDHGGASFGFGHDSIFESGMSTADIQEALSRVYKPNEKKPPFEVIGFDACLMASVEVAHYLDGYGKYLVASEELEPGFGWDYTAWLNSFAQDTGVSGAQIGQYIADSYMDSYIRLNINVGDLEGNIACQFSVIDIAEAEQVYQSYAELCAAALKASIQNQNTMAALGRAASRSTRYADASYRVYNTIDLGNYIDGLTEIFPEESAKVKSALQNAVLYSRANDYLEDSQGLSVYMPVQVEGAGGLMKCLEYIDVVSDDNNISALYYYKLAGCLNEELQAFAEEAGYGKAGVFDASALKALETIPVEITGGNYQIAVDENTADQMQSYQMYLLKAADDGNMVYYGGDNYAVLDGEGNLCTAFDGEWITLDGQILAVEIMDETASGIKYRSKVMHNGKEAYLIFAYDRDSEAFSILGIRDIPETGISSSPDVASRVMSVLSVGDKITPVYEATDAYSGYSSNEKGKTVKYGPNTAVRFSGLENGEYLSLFVVTDFRGDEYYSGMVQFTVSNGKVTSMTANNDYSVITTVNG